MFWNTLLREWKNFLAAQIPQRTYIHLRAIALDFVFFCFRFFEAESGAKVSTISESTKSFSKIFQIFFKNLTLPSLSKKSRKRLQRYGDFSELPNLFAKKSNIFTEPMICCSNAGLTRKSGAKKRQYFGFCKFSSNYFRHFFAHFSHPVRYQSFMLENIFLPLKRHPL